MVEAASSMRDELHVFSGQKLFDYWIPTWEKSIFILFIYISVILYHHVLLEKMVILIVSRLSGAY